MFSIFVEPDNDCWYSALGGRTIQCGPAPSVPWTFGHFGVRIPKPGSSTVPPIEVPFGFLSPGERQWGRLRDRDVLHIDGKGDLLINSVSQYSVPFASSSDLTNHRTTTSFTSNFTYCEIIAWGSDSEVYDFVSVPRIKSSALGKWQSPHTRGATHRILFSGTKALVLRINEAYSYTWENDPATVYNVPPSASLIGYQYTQTGTSAPVIKTSQSYSGVYDAARDAFRFTLPSGTHWSDTMTGSGALTSFAFPFSYESGRSVLAGKMVDHVQLSNQLYARLISAEFRKSVFVHLSDFSGIEEIEDQLGADILDQQSYVDTSILLFVFELAQLGPEAIPKVKNLLRLIGDSPTLATKTLRDLRSIRSILMDLLKPSSNAFLSVKYGVLPTIDDLSKIFDGLNRVFKLVNSSNRTHARRTFAGSGPLPDDEFETTVTLTVELDQFPRTIVGKTMEGIEELRRWGLYPDIDMVWNALPFSFVLDWILNIGDITTSADRILQTQYFNYQYCVIGRKRIWRTTIDKLLPEFGVSGDVEFKYYARACTRDLPIPPVSKLQSKIHIGGEFSLSKFLEGTSLIVQQIR